MLALTILAPARAAVMTWPDLLARPKPTPTRTIAYGADPNQVVDLWLPSDKGPHPMQAARAAGDSVSFETPPGGHVEEVAPGQPAWEAAVAAIRTLLQGATK